MIKINLLPKSINEKRIVRNLAVLFGIVFVAIVAGGVLYAQMVLAPQVAYEQGQAEQAANLEAQVTKLESDTQGVRGSQIAPIQAKLSFISNVLEYNKKYPKLYEEIGKWTYEKIAYTSMTCDGTQVAMSARARSLDDLGRYLLNMYRATDLFTEVTISGVPGYPAGANSTGMPMQQGPSGYGPQANLAGMPAIQEGVSGGSVARYIDFTVNCKLKTPIAAPTFTPGAAAGGAAGATGAPGAPTAPGAPGAPPAPGMGGPPPAPGTAPRPGGGAPPP